MNKKAIKIGAAIAVPATVTSALVGLVFYKKKKNSTDAVITLEPVTEINKVEETNK